MLKLRKVAVTGGLACGKSSVCRFFEKFGAFVVNADEIVHRLLSPETTLGQRIIQLIGSDIIIKNQIDRSKIAQKVFNQPSLLYALEKLIHPVVLEEIKKQYTLANQQEKGKIFVAEIPLLFEANMEDFFDIIITVIAEPTIAKQRFKNAAGSNSKEYEKRSKQQMNIEEKAERADYVIENNGNLKELEAKTKEIMVTIQKLPIMKQL